MTRNYDSFRVTGTKEPHKYDALVILQDEIARHVNDLMQAQSDIIREVYALNTPVLREILIKRYVNFKQFADVAQDLTYSERQIFRLHGTALIALADSMGLEDD